MSTVSTPFAALQARLTDAVITHLANAAATVVAASGQLVEVPGVFDDGHADAGLVADTAPSFVAASADLPGASWADGVTVAGVRYSVTGVQPDGAGLTTLTLRRA